MEHNMRISITAEGKKRLSELVCAAIELAYQQFYNEAACDDSGFIKINPDS